MKIKINNAVSFNRTNVVFVTLFLIVLFVPLFSLAAEKPERTYSLQSLKKEILRIADSGVFTNSRYGIFIKSLKNGEVIFEENSKTPLIPASNIKILTSACALYTLGPEYRFTTDILCDIKPSKGAIGKNIYMRGTGDPELYPENIWQIAQKIKQYGIREIVGNIIVDGSFFSKELSGKSLPTQVNGTTLSATSVNFNSIEYNISPFGDKKPSVSIHPYSDYFSVSNNIKTSPSSRNNNIDVNVFGEKGLREKVVISGVYNGKNLISDYVRINNPSLFAGETLKSILISSGIRVTGKIIEGTTPKNAFLFYSHKSKPLSEIIEDMNKFSNNFIADQLFIATGGNREKPPATADKAVNAEKDYLKGNGISLKDVIIKDGSGLSRDNRISPYLIASVLEQAWSDFDYGPSLISSLPIMGTDGTLKKRLQNSPLKRNIRAKSGYINGTSSLSGYIMTEEKEPIVFSIIINDCSDIIAAKLAQDRIVEITSMLNRAGKK